MVLDGLEDMVGQRSLSRLSPQLQWVLDRHLLATPWIRIRMGERASSPMASVPVQAIHTYMAPVCSTPWEQLDKDENSLENYMISFKLALTIKRYVPGSFG